VSLRNLNQRKSRGRILGTPQSGVLGSLIPSTGVNGPGFAYPSLALPADAAKEICGYITTWPSAGVLDAGENTGFTFSGAPDGIYTFQFQLQADGVDQGAPKTATINQSTPGVTVSCLVGNTIAGGPNATVTQSGTTTVSCQVGNATAACQGASVSQNSMTTISCQPGNASAVCPSAAIVQTGQTIIACRVGNAAAIGSIATVSAGSLISPIPTDYTFNAGHQRIRLYIGQQGNFTPKRAAEIEIFGVDFSDELAPGEAIVSAAWSVTPVDGVDPAANAMIQGGEQLIGSISAQRIGGGVPGVRYAPICTAQTSMGQTIVLPEVSFGELYISG